MPDELPGGGLGPDTDDAEDEEPEDGAAASAKTGGGWLSARNMIVLAVVAAVSVGLALACVSMISANAEGPEPKPEPAADDPTAEAEDVSIKAIYPVENIIVNLSGDRARRFLKTTIHLELSSPKVKELLDLEYNRVRLHDCLISLLSSRTLEEIEHPDSKSRLRREIRDELNLLFTLDDGILHVYFTDFMVQ